MYSEKSVLFWGEMENRGWCKKKSNVGESSTENCVWHISAIFLNILGHPVYRLTFSGLIGQTRETLAIKFNAGIVTIFQTCFFLV